MKVLDLFSGVGGFSLGLEAAGFQTIAFCEIEHFCQKVLKKHWPDIPIYEDVRNVTRERLNADAIFPDVITGGFPCQDISSAGNRAGIEGVRSGLWSECARILGEFRPRYAIFENVPALLSGEQGKWFERVLWDLSEVGYDAEWHCIPAANIGAPHRRDRVWFVAYPNGSRQHGAKHLENTSSRGFEDSRPEPKLRITWKADEEFRGQWAVEPGLGRVANGIPRRVDRIKGLGNAVVPQIPEIIGRAIMEAENAKNRPTE